MRLRWTIPATEDLYRIVQSIQEDNPTAATEIASTIYDGCGTLGRFPRRARLAIGALSNGSSNSYTAEILQLRSGFATRNHRSAQDDKR